MASDFDFDSVYFKQVSQQWRKTKYRIKYSAHSHLFCCLFLPKKITSEILQAAIKPQLFQLLSHCSSFKTRWLKMVLYHHKKPSNTVFTCLYEEVNAYILRMRVYKQHYSPTHQVHFNDKDKHMISWKSQVITLIAKAWSKLRYFCSLHQSSALLMPSMLNFILLKQPGRLLTVQDFKTRINPRRFFTKKHSSWLYTKIFWYIILIHNN